MIPIIRRSLSSIFRNEVVLGTVEVAAAAARHSPTVHGPGSRTKRGRPFERRSARMEVDEAGLALPDEEQGEIDRIVFLRRMLLLRLLNPLAYQPPPILPASWTTLSVSVVVSFPTSLMTSR